MTKYRFIMALALLLQSLAFAGPTTPADVRWSQNLDIDPSTGTTTRYLAVPASGTVCAAVLNGTTRQPACMMLGTGLSIMDNTIVASVQVPSDWNAATGVARILNKPTFAAVAYSGDWGDIVTGKPTTMAGYGITDGVSTASLTVALSGYATTSQLTTGLGLKYNVPSGTTAQYVRGDGSLATLDAYPASSNPAGYLTTISSGQVTTALGFTPYNATNPSAYVTAAGARSAISLTTTGSGAATYNASTGVLNVPTPSASAARSFGNPARTLNSAFQISTTRDASVVYTVDISVTSLLLAGASGRVILEYADDVGMATNVVTVSSSPNATGGVLNVTNLGSGNVGGWIPAGKYARIRTTTTTGSPTFTFQGSQEVLQ